MLCGQDLLRVAEKTLELTPALVPSITALIREDIGLVIELFENPITHKLVELGRLNKAPRSVVELKSRKVCDYVAKFAVTAATKVHNAEAKAFIEKVVGSYSVVWTLKLIKKCLQINKTFTDDLRAVESSDVLLFILQSTCTDLPHAYRQLSPEARDELLTVFELQAVTKLFTKSALSKCSLAAVSVVSRLQIPCSWRQSCYRWMCSAGKTPE